MCGRMPTTPVSTQIITNHGRSESVTAGAVGAKVLALPPPCSKPAEEVCPPLFQAQFGLIFKDGP